MFANANIAKLICDENPSIIFNHIQTRDLFTFKYLFDIHHPELFTYLFEKAPLAIQNQVRTYFYHLGIGYIDFFQPYLLIRILHLSPRILNPILRFDDDLLIRKALSSYFPQIIDYLVQYPPDDFLAIIENNNYFILRALVRYPFLPQLHLIFNFFPEHIQTFVKANKFSLFITACESNNTHVIQYLTQKTPSLIYQMIKAQKFKSFFSACLHKNEFVIQLLSQLWSKHPRHPNYILTYKNFMAIFSTIELHNQDICIQFIDKVKDRLIAHARLTGRCELFETASNQEYDLIASLLLGMYEKENIVITSSLVSLFLEKGFRIEFNLLKKILKRLDDEVIIDLLRINEYEQLKEAFDDNRYDILDLLMSNFQTPEPYRECIEALKMHAGEHHSWLEMHSYLSSIQQMTLSFTQSLITKELPEYQEVLAQYPKAHWPKVLYFFQSTLKNLTFMPAQLTQYLDSLKSILQVMTQVEVPIQPYFYPCFHFNMSILELIFRHNRLAIPLLELEKWLEYYDFLKVVRATLEHDFKTIYSILPRHFENKKLEKVAYEHCALALIVNYSELEQQLTPSQHSKIKRLIACYIADKEFQRLHLEAEVPTQYLEYIWLNYLDVYQMIQESIQKIQKNTAEKQLLQKISLEKDYHPLVFEFLVMLPTFQSTVFKNHHCFQICILEHLLLQMNPLLEFKESTKQQIKNLNDNYHTIRQESSFDYLSHVQTNYFLELRALNP